MPKTMRELIDEVLEERAQAITYSPDEIEQKAARLMEGFARIDATAAERRQIHAALQTLPPERRRGWLEGVQSIAQVVVDTAHRSSRILLDAARDLLPASPDAWAFSYEAGGVTRAGGEEVKKVEVQNPPGATSRTMSIIDRGSETCLKTVFEGVSADASPPVQLIMGIKAEDGTPFVIEVDPEVGEKSTGIDAVPRHWLRYEAIIPSGTYTIAYGNPRGKQS